MYDIEQKMEAVLKTKLTNQSLIEMYYQVGTMISHYNSKEIKELELKLKNKYGVVIAFTERNLLNMLKFSKYPNRLLPKLKEITWKNILVILKEDNNLIDICLEYKPTKQELVNFIKQGKPLKKNKSIELDDTLEELLKLQKEVR